MNDLQIFRDGLVHQLEGGERVEADDGYVGEAPLRVKCPGSYASRTDQEKVRGRVRMRHVTINEKIKNFKCMSVRFRHKSHEKHAACFRAVVVITQLTMELGEELFDCREYDDTMSDDQVRQLFNL